MLSESLKKEFAEGIPGLRTQAQYDVAVTTLGLLQEVLSAHLRGDAAQAAQARTGLEQGLDMAGMLFSLMSKLVDIPEEQRSGAAKNLARDAAELDEVGLAEAVLSELSDLKSLKDLGVWYSANKDRLSGLISPSIRSSVFDHIRRLKVELQ